jgi:hypothetical protein
MFIPVEISDDDLRFILAAERQLYPVQRAQFEARVREILSGVASPGSGDVNRAVRTALQGLWDPPIGRDLPSRWSRKR